MSDLNLPETEGEVDAEPENTYWHKPQKVVEQGPARKPDKVVDKETYRLKTQNPAPKYGPDNDGEAHKEIPPFRESSFGSCIIRHFHVSFLFKITPILVLIGYSSKLTLPAK